MNIGVTEISPRAVQRAAEKNFKSGYYCCEALMCTIRDEFKLDVPKEVIAMLNGLSRQIFCVRGNCEAEVDQMVLEFPVMADYMTMWTDDRMFFCTHGHLYDIENMPNISEGDVVLSGHTHLFRAEKKNGIYYINTGSVSLPKGGNPKSYVIYKDRMFEVLDMDGKHLTGIVAKD